MKLIGRCAVAGVLLLSACGGSGSGVSEPAAKILDAQVNALRDTAARADRGSAEQQLDLLRASIDQLRSDGELSASAARRIRQSADAVESQLVLLPAPTTTTTTTTVPPPDERSWKSENRGRENNGKGKSDEDD